MIMTKEKLQEVTLCSKYLQKQSQSKPVSAMAPVFAIGLGMGEDGTSY